MIRLDSDIRTLWSGCLLGSVAHAVALLETPELEGLQNWDGINYLVKDFAGAFGVVTFKEGLIVGAFWDSSEKVTSHIVGLDETPPRIREIAETESFLYLLQETGGESVPMVSSLFWSQGTDLLAGVGWGELERGGAHLVSRQLSTSPSLARWSDELGLEDDKTDLVLELFSLRLMCHELPVSLGTGVYQKLHELEGDGQSLMFRHLEQVGFDLRWPRGTAMTKLP